MEAICTPVCDATAMEVIFVPFPKATATEPVNRTSPCVHPWRLLSAPRPTLHTPLVVWICHGSNSCHPHFGCRFTGLWLCLWAPDYTSVRLSVYSPAPWCCQPFYHHGSSLFGSNRGCHLDCVPSGSSFSWSLISVRWSIPLSAMSWSSASLHVCPLSTSRPLLNLLNLGHDDCHKIILYGIEPLGEIKLHASKSLLTVCMHLVPYH